MQICMINHESGEYCNIKTYGKLLKWYIGKIGEKTFQCKTFEVSDYENIIDSLLDAGFSKTERSVADLTSGINIYSKASSQEIQEIRELIQELKVMSKSEYPDVKSKLRTGIETIKNTINALEAIQELVDAENEEDENYIEQIKLYLSEIAQIFPEVLSTVNDIDTYNISEKIGEIKKIITIKYNEELARYREWKLVKNHLYSMGVTIKPADAKLKDEVKSRVGSNNFKCWYVVNSDTELLYNENMKDNNSGKHGKEELLWHGSADVNWERILLDGLKIRPGGVETKDEGWFGQGIYFSKDFHVAKWYSDRKSKQKKCYVALFKVRTGNCHQIILKAGAKQKQTDINKEYLDDNGLDSVHVLMEMGKGLAERELAIFDPAQATIYALVEIIK